MDGMAKRRKSDRKSLLRLEADMRKARLVSAIRERGELGEEEENKGRS